MRDESPRGPRADDLGATEREIIAQRAKKAEALRALGVNPFGNGHAPQHLAATSSPATATRRGGGDREGRRAPGRSPGACLAIRSFGKAAFLRVRDGSGELQVWVKKDKVGERGFECSSSSTSATSSRAEGPATRTKTGELTVEAASFTILTKSHAPAAGEVARAHRRRAALPAALRRPRRHARRARDVPEARRAS